MKTKVTNSDFEETFSSLKRMGERFPGAKNAFELLKRLSQETTTSESAILVYEVDKIQYQSNTNGYFYFYFPIVSHILYYKPEYEKDLLKYLTGPNFANGTSEAGEMISIIKGAMEFKLQENKLYLSKESQFWVLNELPKLKKEIQREIDVCRKELEE